MKSSKKWAEKLEEDLSEERTLLSNERTLLSYIRTAFAIIVAGIAILGFLRTGGFRVVGIILVIIGVLFFIVGFIYYASRKKKIKKEAEDLGN